jgi:ABC-2 type transport system ATP-binding protein
VRYGAVTAVDNVSFDLRSGEIVGLIGPNGAGKTTLMSLVTRLFEAREGQIRVCGQSIKEAPRAALSRMGVVFQRLTLDLDLTVAQNLRYAAAMQWLPRRRAIERILAALGQLGVAEHQPASLRTISGGMRRRVELARALLHEPDLLILDEPTVGLDIDSRRNIVEHVHRLCREQGLAVLWPTHLIDEIRPGDRVVLIHQGSVRAEGTIEEILAVAGEASLDEAYRRLTRKPQAA